MSSSIAVRPARTEGDAAAFIGFPWKVYKTDPHWVPPLRMERRAFLDPKKNPFHDHAEVQLFLAYKGSDVVGTIAAIVNHKHNEMYSDRTGFFGLFETLRDDEIATALFDTAARWLTERGMQIMRGPMSFSTHGQCGLLIDGFDQSPVIMMPYNPDYYVDFVEGYGFQKNSNLYAYERELNEPPEFLVDIAQEVARNGNVQARNANMKRYDAEMGSIKAIYNEAWSRNWGYLPLSEAEFDHMVKGLKTVADPDFIYFAEVEGNVVGFSISLPDLNVALRKANGRLFPFGMLRILWNKRRIDLLRVWALGVKREFHDRRLGALLYLKTWEAGRRKGYRRVEASWIHESNKPMNRALEWMGAKIYKTYRIYDYSLAGSKPS